MSMAIHHYICKLFERHVTRLVYYQVALWEVYDPVFVKLPGTKSCVCRSLLQQFLSFFLTLWKCNTKSTCALLSNVYDTAIHCN